jgi:hypothetical protein
MLHLIYILAFTILAFLAVGNLIRNLMTLGIESQRYSGNQNRYPTGASAPPRPRIATIPHPELLDDQGNLVNEPFLVMRSMTVDDARERLDELYKASPGYSDEAHDEA